MKAFRPFHITLSILFLTALTAVSAAAQTPACLSACPVGGNCIDFEDDTWITQGTTHVRFSDWGIDLGSLLGGTPDNTTTVLLNGVPLNSSLGKADTLLSRSPVNVSGSSYSACLSIKGLQLLSSNNIDTQDGHLWQVGITLSSQNGSGQLSFSQTSSDGGTFSSSFVVIPIVTFTDVSSGSTRAPVQLDCGASTNNCSISMSGSGNYLFTSQTGFDPRTQGIPTVPSGVQIGNYTTKGRKRYGGIQVGCGGTKSAGYHCNTQDQGDEAHGFLGQANGHDVQPANDCGSSDVSQLNGTTTTSARVSPNKLSNSASTTTGTTGTGTTGTGTGGTGTSSNCSTTQ